MRFLRRVLGPVAALWLVGCGGASARAASIAKLEGDSTSGKALYESTAVPTCASCHRIDGTGGASKSAPDLHTPAKYDTPAGLAEQILTGEGAMPGYASALSDPQVADVVAHLKAAFGQ